MNTCYRKVNVPIFGCLYLLSTEKGLSRIFMSEAEFIDFQANEQIKHGEDDSPAAEAGRQLIQYFSGERKGFEVPLDLKGTPFQQKVWDVLSIIPYGEAWSYGDVARKIDNPKAVRAVGQANRNNPVPIIVPCHRVIGTSGKLTGYAGNKISLKEELLQLEGINARNGVYIR